MRQMISTATIPRLPAAIQPAVRRLKSAAATAAERTVESLGLSALTAVNLLQRDGHLAAQFELNRKLAVFCQNFDRTLDERLQREVGVRQTPAGSGPAATWESLSLVDDHEVEVQVAAERLGRLIGHGCEWELRELDGYVEPMLAAAGQPRQDSPRNPLRPETIGYAVIRAIEAVTERGEVRKVLESEFSRSFAAAMPQIYAAVISDLRSAGLRAAGMTVRISESAPSDALRPERQSGFGALPPNQGFGRTRPSGLTGLASSRPQPMHSMPGGLGASGTGHGRGSPGPAHRGMPMGQVDAELMALMRRLTATDRSMSILSGFGSDTAPSSFEAYSDDGLRLAAPNLIRVHRDALRQAAGGAMDHMVIDVVGSLFDQILSDPKVPPQMARQIGRLQLPVLRAALGDPSFFSSRKHPVRRFINRIAGLATAREDLDDERGRQFLKLVREMVQGIVDGDFDHADVYEQKLAQLEAFVAEQAREEIGDEGDALSVLAAREGDIRVQHHYAQRLSGELQTLSVPEFVREFLSTVWSLVLVKATRTDGADSPRAQRMRHAGRELFMSVQPKGTPAQRKEFLTQLPKLMQELNEGMDLIGWPESAKKTFFGLLLPAHAQSLKGEGLRTLDFNLLAKQVDQVFDRPLPAAAELPAVTDPGALEDGDVLPTFTPEEAKRVGLVSEAAVDWGGKIDIDLGAEAPVTEIDIAIDGLPLPEPVEPTRGKSLADHVQIGFAYQMHLQGEWQKVRLNHVSPGRTFFVFTHGQRHKQTVSLTYRMLLRLCESGRLRAFESAYLLERATARARRQLAELKRPAATH